MRIKNLAACSAAAAIAATFFSAPASAGTASATFQVTADVLAACSVSATTLNFANYTSSAGNKDVQSTVSVTCSNGTTYNVGLNEGASTGATVSARAMTGPASALLNYSLFSDSGRTVNWGNTVPTDTVGGTGSGAAQTLNVYGRIPGSQYVAIGHYTDTITATVTF